MPLSRNNFGDRRLFEWGQTLSRRWKGPPVQVVFREIYVRNSVAPRRWSGEEGVEVAGGARRVNCQE